MKKNKDGFAFPAYGSGNRAGADGSKVKEKRFRYSCHYVIAAIIMYGIRVNAMDSPAMV